MSNLMCTALGHKWTKWYQPNIRLSVEWFRHCERCKSEQTGGYGKRPNYHNLKIWRVV